MSIFQLFLEISLFSKARADVYSIGVVIFQVKFDFEKEDTVPVTGNVIVTGYQQFCEEKC